MPTEKSGRDPCQMEGWVLPGAELPTEPLRWYPRAAMPRVRDGERCPAGAQDEHPGLHQHRVAPYQLRASSVTLPCVGTAGAAGSYRGWVRPQGWDRGAPGHPWDSFGRSSLR